MEETKKPYQLPAMTVIEIKCADIIATSPLVPPPPGARNVNDWGESGEDDWSGF